MPFPGFLSKPRAQTALLGGASSVGQSSSVLVSLAIVVIVMGRVSSRATIKLFREALCRFVRSIDRYR